MNKKINNNGVGGKSISPRSLFSRTVLAASVAMAIGCSDDGPSYSFTPPEPISGGSEAPSPELAKVRVIHASVDAPAVNIALNGAEAIADLDYGESSNYADIQAQAYDISVLGILPNGTAEVISVPGFDFTADSKTTIIAIDPVATIKPWVVSDSAASPSDSEVALKVVHASSVAPEVDVYVTAPGTDLENEAPAFTFAYEGEVDAGALAAGTVHIRVTPKGTKDVVFDSGPVDLTPFAGQKLLLVAVSTENATKQAASPIKIVTAADDASLVLYDVDTSAGARVVHASPDAAAAAGGDVEVFATSAALGDDPVELIPAFGYLGLVPAADSHVSVPAGEYVFDVAPDTDMIGDSVFMSDSISLVAGMEYTVIAAGRVTSSPSFGLLLSADESRAIATQASVKVIHAAPAAGDVDVYVTPAGAYDLAAIEAGTVTPLLSDFAYADMTDYVVIEPGDYDVRVVAGGTAAINIEGLTLGGGSVSTVIARGPSESGDDPNDFGVVLLTN